MYFNGLDHLTLHKNRLDLFPDPSQYSQPESWDKRKFQGKCLKGRDSIVLGDQQGRLSQGSSSLNPLTLQGKLYRGSGPLTLWGIGVHSGPGDLHPQSLVK